jgi:hypothetical protein
MRRYCVADEGRLRESDEKYEGYMVYDNAGEKVGKVDELLVDEADREEYIGVKMGLLGTKSILIPMDMVRANERDRAMEVAESRDRIREAPTYEGNDDITDDYEDRIRRHFGLDSLQSSVGRTSSAASATNARPAKAGGEEGQGMIDDADEEPSVQGQGGRRSRTRRRVTREETEILEEEEDVERRDT